MWASQPGGATFTIYMCECSVSDPVGLKKLTLDVPGVPLRCKKVIRVRKSEVGVLRVNFNGETLGLDKSGPRREVVCLLRWSGGHTVYCH